MVPLVAEGIQGANIVGLLCIPVWMVIVGGWVGWWKGVCS